MEKNKRIYLDLHVLQTVPPSCINRDDSGSPKTAVYGGVNRARVSSQSWKHAMREMFAQNFDESELGVRTKKIVRMVAAEVQKIDASVNEEKAMELAEKVINLCGVKTDKQEAKALFFLSAKQAHNLAELIINNTEATKKEAQAVLRKDHSVDIALFGRMVADDPSLNADAAAQVAHSISTHQVENEYDYFTAVDELAPEDNAGAGMIGMVEFNSATLYRYATIAVHGLYKELGNDKETTVKAVREFIRAFALSMPTGKQNTFANRTAPNALLVTLRLDQPVNMVGAFEKAVRSENGYVEKSVEALKDYKAKVESTFVSAPAAEWSTGMDDNSMKMDELLDAVVNAVTAEVDK